MCNANKTYGYIKVSESMQNEDEQMAALLDYGVNSANIYKDNLMLQNQSGCPAYQDMISRVCFGDVIVVKNIYQLGDNYENILQEWENLTEDKGTAIVVLDMPLPESTKVLDRLFVSEFMLDILRYFTTTTKETKKRRQTEGIHAAHSRGVKFGRPTKKCTAEYERVKEDYIRGRISCVNAAAQLNVNRGTFRNWIAEDRKSEGK